MFLTTGNGVVIGIRHYQFYIHNFPEPPVVATAITIHLNARR
jgi:hypothetical protein